MRPRIGALAVLPVIALLAAACTNGNDRTDVTPQPTEPTRVEQVATFQVVGTVENAFEDVEPPFDVPDHDPVAVAGPTTLPTGTPVGDAPSAPGVLRLSVEDVNQELTDACGVSADSEVAVYWTTSTRFDPSDVLDDVEDGITGEVAGISGRVFEQGSEDGDVTPEPDASDEPGDEPGDEPADEPEPSADCVLVADQIGFEDDSASATRAPTVRRTAAPTTDPETTEEPTAEPEETRRPERTPSDTATPTARQAG